jgi:signal transduction histidine kinase
MIDSTLKNAHILIIDDKQPNIDVLVGYLQIQGYTNIETVSDSRLALSTFISFQPDLILLDLMMPYLSGYEVMAQLKEVIPAGTYLPILVLTADISIEARQRALSDGAKDFLAKPLDLIEVGLRIGNLLESRYLHQQLKNQNQHLELKVREKTQELERRVIERTAQLEVANHDLEAFAYSVSHDLRAPLRHITGFSNMLLEMNTTQRTEEETRYLKIISNGALEMGKLVEALLTFSRLKRTELHKTTINTAAMVGQVIAFFEPETKNRNLTIRPGHLADCEGDPQLLKQVWINLISNAIKYTGRQPEAIIEIGSTIESNEITYFIKDNGAGFDMKYVKKLFGVFKRLHKHDDFEGVGIGLANVNSIITRHGGHCSATGETGKGATFFFSLPVAVNS